jgi:hypothetical protein
MMEAAMDEDQETVDESSVIDETSDVDELLDQAAQGASGTSDATATGTGEIDAIGRAAGLVSRDDRPFRGIDEVERRDGHRWELDPASAWPG